MVEVARHNGLDVLHVHYAIPNAVSAVLARQILAPQPLPVVHGSAASRSGDREDGVCVRENLVVEEIKRHTPVGPVPEEMSDAQAVIDRHLKRMVAPRNAVEREAGVIGLAQAHVAVAGE